MGKARAITQTDRASTWTSRETREFEDALAAILPDLRTRCRALVRHPDDPDDLVSLTLERGFRYGDSYDPARPLLPWLWGIARRLSVAHGPSSNTIEAPEASEAEPAALPIECLDPADLVDLDRPSDRVALALDVLSARQRRALLLWAVQGLSIPEVAEFMGLEPQAARSLIKRARKTFQTAFGEQAGVGGPDQGPRL